MPDAQTQYWSLVSCEAAPSGQVVDGLTDMQVPLDADRNYTIVVSRPEDRPKNATLENGVAWMNWRPRGEGLDDPRNRADFGMLMLRIMANNPSWENSPDKVTRPGTEEAVMGPVSSQGRIHRQGDVRGDGAEEVGPRRTKHCRHALDQVCRQRRNESRMHHIQILDVCGRIAFFALRLPSEERLPVSSDSRSAGII